MLDSASVGVLRGAVAVGGLLSAVAVGIALAFLMAVASLFMVPVGLEELLRFLPTVLLAGGREHGGDSKDGGGDSGLHVGVRTG